MQVLIVTRSDVSVGAVVRGLCRRGLEPVVLQADHYPAQVSVSRSSRGLTVRQGGMRIPLYDLGAVWYRRMGLGLDLPADTPPDVRRGVVQESRAHLLGALASLDVFVLGPKHVLDHADLKPRQLSLAAACGLAVPATLVTTDAAALRGFTRRHDDLVTKVLTSFQVRQQGEGKVVMTRRLTPDDLDGLDDLSSCPATFQERLVRRREWRVTVVGDRVFAAAVGAEHFATDDVDWRREGRSIYRHWRPATLPGAVSAGLLRLMARLGLHYGAADFIETPDGRMVFLEVNPAGEYLWLDPVFDGAISEAIAGLLASRCPVTRRIRTTALEPA